MDMLIVLGLILLLAGCGGGADEPASDPNYVRVNGIRIHFSRSEGGEGKPTVVLVHGVTDSGRCWSTIARALEEDYDVVYYDVRGHGLSDKPSSGYKLQDHVNDLVALLDALNIEKPVLYGHSMGGGIVAQAAADHPDLPRAVVLEDPAFFPQPENLADVIGLARSFLKSFQNVTKAQMLTRAADENPTWTQSEMDAWAEAKHQFTPRILETIYDLPDIGALLPCIEAPVLLMKADASPDERRKHIEAASGIRDGKLIHIDGAGHSIHRDKPAETLAAVRDFLDSSI